MVRGTRGAAARLAALLMAAIITATIAPAAATAVSPPTVGLLPDRDFRAGSISPTAAQRTAVQNLGAAVRWNRFGTPQSLIKYGGWLASGLTGRPEAAARRWVRTNRGLFRLSDADVTNLDLVAVNQLRGSEGYAVLFRQRFGNLAAGQDGLIIVGIRAGKVAYVSSSAAGSMPAPAGATLSATAAWRRAAADIGRATPLGSIGSVREVDGWSAFDVTGFATPAVGKSFVGQRARLVAVPTFNNGVRAAYETIVLDLSGGQPIAYTSFVDARSGAILMRYNRVDHAEHDHAVAHDEHAAEAPTFGQFSGTTNAGGGCGPDHQIAAPAGTRTIDIVASATNPVNDIVLYLLDASKNEITHTDTGTSPEAVHHEFGAPTSGTFYARVCQFNLGQAAFTYDGAFATNDAVSSGSDFNYPPKWKYFRANPSLQGIATPPYVLSDNDTRLIGCWVRVHNGVTVPECSNAVGDLNNLASRVPWDHQVQSNTPSFTTIGNNAVSGEAWTTPLTPGPSQQRPVHLDRRYVDEWDNVWNEERCSPTTLTPAGNDIYAAVTSLFVNHNRMHDWSYFLGFTEHTWNLQQNNFGNNPGAGAEGDPEYGQAQSGAALPVAAGVSRDNANQITLNDGIPGITNMYLWQPIAGGFYAPCVDGDYDMSVIAHEYTHAISNRMAGGPDANLTGTQGRAMGESWSDLAAIEYLNAYGLVPTNDENRFTVGAYVTGNKVRGIRNYNMSMSPLNYSNVGYDFVCNAPIVGPPIEENCPDGRTQVHADGEIWSAVNFDIRQALIQKYNGNFPASNASRQRACANGQYPASSCPGNRRWIQIMFDAWLLMPGSVSMLDARDAYLAADMLRFNGANQTQLWRAFARRGFGADATTTGASDVDPVPSFRSPLEASRNIRFRVRAADEGNVAINSAKVYVGHYEAGSTPIADTIPGGSLTDTARFVAGTYEFLVVAPGYGHVRFSRSISGSGNETIDVRMSTNRASIHKGAVALGTGSNVNNLFDDSEATNWTGNAPVNAQLVTVDLQGSVQNVKRVNVSAMLNPESGGRFRALRRFEIWTCNGNTATCANPLNYTRIFTSPANAFPGVRPRPTAPDLILRTFDVPDTNATHVQLRVVSSQCTASNTGFRGDQDNDPSNDTDCVSGSAMDELVRAAELQVFTSTPVVAAQDPAVLVTVSAPATAPSGSQMSYSISYTNAGPNESSNATLSSVLPEGVTFVSATDGGSYNTSTRTVSWSLGTVNVGFTGTRSVTVKVDAPAGTALVTSATYQAPETVAITADAITAVGP
jgi:extracellular elastinolytic metalloproteinase